MPLNRSSAGSRHVGMVMPPILQSVHLCSSYSIKCVAYSCVTFTSSEYYSYKNFSDLQDEHVKYL